MAKSVTDTTIAQSFMISPRMLQRWKHSNDYRYLIYMYLKKDSKAQFDQFLTDIQEEDNYKKDIKFMRKKDFLNDLIENEIEQFGLQRDTDEWKYDVELANRLRTKIGGQYSFKLLNKGSKTIRYYELSSRFPSEKEIKNKGKLLRTLEPSYSIDSMNFITYEDRPSIYIDDEEGQVPFSAHNIYIDEYASRYLQSRKIIFIPPELGDDH